MAVGLRMASRAQVPIVYFADQLLGILTASDLQELIHFRFQPVVILLGCGRSDIEEIGEANDLPDQLEKFRLPILERVPPHLDRVGRQLRHLSM